MIAIPSRLILAIIVGLALFGSPSVSAAAPPSARDFAREAAISNVVISPDGKHIAALRSVDGDHTDIAVWSADSLNTPPTILGAVSQLTIMGVSFIKNDRLAVQVRQTADLGADRRHIFKLFITDLQGKTWRSALPEANDPRLTSDERMYNALTNPRILYVLPQDPKHIIVEDQRFNGGGDIYLVDVQSGGADRVLRGSERFGAPITDRTGEVRARSESNTDNGKAYIAQWIRNAGGGPWEEHFRTYAADRAGTALIGFTNDPNIAYVSVTKGRDKAAIYEYDVRQKKLLEKVFEHRLFEVGRPVLSAGGQLLGFTYQAEAGRIYWTDEKLAAMESAIAQAMGVQTQTMAWTDPGTGMTANIPVETQFGAHISDWSDDLSRVIVEKSGPNQPPVYYLLTGGSKMTLLGRSRPQIDVSTLGDSRMVEYAARDGLVIPAFLHTPSKALFGAGPYPAIILPHGGPWGRDDLDWDISGWTKYFTARGYVVIQPQFRGSDGWGQKLWRAGDKEWGQKMQDDNDDAAKWLIAQGLAAPNRIALFGYSYGGYAAFAAAVRPNGLYQCSIAGAGVADLRTFQGETEQDRFEREYQRPTIEGLNVLQHAREISIPIFIYNGDRDTTVDPSESHHFRDAVKSAGKPYKYLEIKDMGHQYVTMTAADLELQLVEIEKFLKGECKPGGL